MIQERSYSSAIFLERSSFQNIWKKKIQFFVQWLLNIIFTNKLHVCLVLFTYKLLVFQTFCFRLIVQLLTFNLVRFLTNNSFHTFETSTRCWVKIFRLGVSRCLVDSKDTHYLMIISNPFDCLYLLLIAGKINPFLSYKSFQNFLV